LKASDFTALKQSRGSD